MRLFNVFEKINGTAVVASLFCKSRTVPAKVKAVKNATDFTARLAAATKRQSRTSIEHVGTALQSRPARATIGLKPRTGLETRPHMFYHF